jgi:Mrp family chromosome partitioning ATPase
LVDKVKSLNVNLVGIIANRVPDRPADYY